MGILPRREPVRNSGYRWALALTLSAAFACGGDSGATVTAATSTVPEPTSTASEELGSVVGTWGLASITVDGEPMALSPELATYEHPEVAAWIRFDDGGSVDGQLSCNHFMGEYEQHGSTIDWEIVKDSGLCLEPEGVMDAEQPMADLIFTLTVDVEIDEEVIELAGSDVVMTFDRLDD